MAMRSDSPFDVDAIQESALDRAARRAVRREVDGLCSFRNMAIRLTGPGHGVDNPGGGGGGGESGETLIRIISVKNTAASTKTNEPVVIPLPTPATAYPTGQNNIAIYDDDGSGGRGALIGFQRNAVATDKAGKTRFAVVSVIVPSFSSTQNRKLRAYATSTAEPTGTAITASDILATSYNVRASYTISGTAQTADATTALGGSTTFSKTAAWTRGTWASGPYCTTIVCETPLQNGGTAHNSGDGLRAVFIITAWKAGSGAVNGGNPIVYIHTRVIIENGAIDRTSVSDYVATAVSISRSTSLSDATLISTTDTDADGSTLTYNFSSGFTHPYGERFSRPVHVGTKPTNVMAWGEVSDASSANDVMLTWLRTAGLYLNNQTAAADVTNDAWAGDETVPFADTGDMLASQVAGGERQEIGVFSEWELKALAKWDANGRRRVWLNAERLNHYYQQCIRRFTTPSAGAVGMYGRPDSEFYKYNNAYTGGTLIATPGTWNTTFSALDISHEPNHCAAAYLMSGDYYYLEALNGRCSAYTTFFDHGGTPAITKTLAGDSTNTTSWAFNQMRGLAWGLRSLAMLALLTPDDKTDGKLCWTKTITNTWLDNTYEKLNDTTAANTDAGGNWYTANGPRYIWGGNGQNGVGQDNQYAPWQNGYLAHTLGWIDPAGMGNADMDGFVAWFGKYFPAVHNDSGVAPDYLHSTYYLAFRAYNDGSTPGALITDYTTLYKENALMVPGIGNGAGIHRRPSGTLVLDALSGASVGVTLPSGLLNTTWHIGGWIKAGSGRGRITAITDASHCTIDTTVTHGAAFASTSIAQAAPEVFDPAWIIAGPHPDEAGADGSLFSGVTTSNYTDVYRAACAIMADFGITGAAAAFTYAEGCLAGNGATETKRKYYVTARAA